MAKNRAGRLIVIDGADGSGKATQTKLIRTALSKMGYKVKTIDFPQYKENFFGRLLKHFLMGEMGDFISYDPHIASVVYAADRFESSKKIMDWLDKGYIVVCDRYVSANQIHQGGKIHNSRKREEFLRWLDKMEYGIFKIPKPDIVVYLNVAYEISARLLEKRVKQQSALGKVSKKDLAEENKQHLIESRESALKLVQGSNKWAKIECAPEGDLLPRSVIRDLILARIKRTLPKL